MDLSDGLGTLLVVLVLEGKELLFDLDLFLAFLCSDLKVLQENESKNHETTIANIQNDRQQIVDKMESERQSFQQSINLEQQQHRALQKRFDDMKHLIDGIISSQPCNFRQDLLAFGGKTCQFITQIQILLRQKKLFFYVTFCSLVFIFIFFRSSGNAVET